MREVYMSCLKVSESDSLRLNNLEFVWSLERANFEDTLSGKNRGQLDSVFHAIQKKTGLEKHHVQAIAQGTGTAGLLMAGAAALLASDGVKMFGDARNIENIDRLFAKKIVNVNSFNWDSTSEVLNSLKEWLLPSLQKRRSSLAGLVNDNLADQKIVDRANAYDSALKELDKLVVFFSAREQVFQEKWKQKIASYTQFSTLNAQARIVKRRQIEQQRVALLLDQRQYDEAIEQLESEERTSCCSWRKLTSRCSQVRTEAAPYCPQHLCFCDNCTEPVISEGSHYCRNHQDRGESHSAQAGSGVGIPERSGEQDLSPSGKNSSSSGSVAFVVVLLIFVVLVFIFAAAK
jgi:hypothetical protein